MVMAGRRRGGLGPGIWLSLVLCISPALARQDRPDAVLFYSAALAEARLPEQGGSAEDFQNFYAKTKDMEVDRDLIEKLRLAQQEIDSGEEAVTGSGVEAAEGGDLLQDFTLRKALFGESNERLVEARISCFSCDAPNCTASHVSRDCSACYTAQVRDTDGEEERSKGCVASPAYYAMICSTRQYDGRHTHAVHGVSAQYAISCCQEEFCNNATAWPELPAVPSVESEPVDGAGRGRGGHVARLVLAVVCPVAVLGLLVTLILAVMRYRHRKRMAELNTVDSLSYQVRYKTVALDDRVIDWIAITTVMSAGRVGGAARPASGRLDTARDI